MPEKQTLFFPPLVSIVSCRLFLYVFKKKINEKTFLFKKNLNYLKKKILKNPPTSREAQKQTPLPNQKGQEKPSKLSISGSAGLGLLSKLEQKKVPK